MGKRTTIKLIIRTIILLSILLMTLIDVNLVSEFINMSIVGNIKLYQLLWIYLMYEMVIVLTPKFNRYSYSGKNFKRHYNEAKNYDKKKLEKYTDKNRDRALRAAIFWIILNSLIGYISIPQNYS